MVRIVSTAGLDKESFYDRQVDGIIYSPEEVHSQEAHPYLELRTPVDVVPQPIDLGTPLQEIDL